MEKDRERIFELLADQTLFGLTAGETAELENLKADFKEFRDDDSLEMTAAAIQLASLEIDDSMPAHLQTKLEARAQEFFNAPQNARQFAAPENDQRENSSANENVGKIYEIPARRPMWQWFGWATAAACLLIAIGFWLTRPKPQPEIAEQPKPAPTPIAAKSPELAQVPENLKTPEPARSPETVKTPETEKTPESAKIPKNAVTPETAKTPELAKIPQSAKTPAPELTAAQKREQLLASAPDVIKKSWTAAKGDKRVVGDIVWSGAQQKGFIRLRDLPALDASRETYQLWIVDARHEKTPVSGGIFNVSSVGEIVIPINAELKIGEAKQFAITKEKAGGVTASKPDRVVAVAKV